MSRRVTNILSRYADLKDAHIATITNQHSYKVSQFHKSLKCKFGKSLEKLQVIIRLISVSNISFNFFFIIELIYYLYHFKEV